MDITRIGKTVIPTTGYNLVLDNVLHVPATQKNLISGHHFTLDNDTFIEFHPFIFFIKDQKTRKVLFVF
jgi:serine protease inhibitor